jgi:1,4-dihydroxy-2-naphthoyl-CoA hydrolase
MTSQVSALAMAVREDDAMAPDPTTHLTTTMPFCSTLEMRARSLDAAEVELELDWAEELCTSNGLMHGGVLMALADSAGGACAAANLPADAVGTSTIESKTNFLGAVRSGTVHAVCRPLHVGGTTIVVETEVRDDRDRLVAKTTQTQVVLRPKP